MGYVSAHPFNGGKAASMAYFRHCGASEETAWRMAHEDLKDQPSDFLPGRATPRYWMERFGNFMGETMGAEWTLGVELARLAEAGAERVVVESVVYEWKVLKSHGGKIYRVVRDVEGPEGIMSDEAQASIPVDGTIDNNGSLGDLITAMREIA